MSRFVKRVFAAACIASFAPFELATAGPVVFDFENFSDGTAITNQVQGLTFGQATAIRAGVSLNEFEFPPHSGQTVIFDDGGAIVIDFAAPVFGVGGYFTYLNRLNFSVYDVMNNLLSSRDSLFNDNLALSGDVGSRPNEFLSLTNFGVGISRAVVSGATGGGSFTLDDLTIDATVNAVPEPSTLLLTICPLIALLVIRTRKTAEQGFEVTLAGPT